MYKKGPGSGRLVCNELTNGPLYKSDELSQQIRLMPSPTLKPSDLLGR